MYKNIFLCNKKYGGKIFCYKIFSIHRVRRLRAGFTGVFDCLRLWRIRISIPQEADLDWRHLIGGDAHLRQSGGRYLSHPVGGRRFRVGIVCATADHTQHDFPITQHSCDLKNSHAGVSFANCQDFVGVALWVNPFSAGAVFRRQTLTSVDVRFRRLMTVFALIELNKL